MEQILKNTSIIGTSISIQLEQWQLKRQLMELYQQQQRAAESSPGTFVAAPSAVPPSSFSNQTQTSSNFFPPRGYGTYTGHENLTHFSSRSTSVFSAAAAAADEQSLENIMGPARESEHVLLSMMLIYSVILFSGIIGNTLTLYVIWRHPRMHAGATNYYLASLAVSDLISLVFGLPLEMFQLFQSHPYPLPEVACVARGWLTEMATNSSVLCILLFSFERYLAVVHPFQIRLRSRVYRALPLVVGAWLVAFIAAAPIALQLGIAYKVVNRFTGQPREGTQLCIIKHPLPHSFQLSTVFLFVLPMLIIIVFHVVIVIKLLQASRSQGSLNRAVSSEGVAGSGEGGAGARRNNDPTLRFSRGRRAVLRMLASVALAFFICYAPFHSQRLLASYLSNIVGNDPSAFAAYKTYLFISGILYYSASTVNPILYNILSIRFRRAFLEALIGCIPGCPRAGAHGSPPMGGSPNAQTLAARKNHHFHQLRRTYTNPGTNECNSIGGGGGYDTDGYSLSSRTVAMNVLNGKMQNGTQKSRIPNGASSHQHLRRVAGPCQSVSSNQISSTLLPVNNVVWRTNSFSSQSECEDNIPRGNRNGDENASADYSTTQSLELLNHQKRRKNEHLSSSQRRRLLMDNSRNNSIAQIPHQNGGSFRQKPQIHTNFLNSLDSDGRNFESTTVEISDAMRMRTAAFQASSEYGEILIAQQQLDFDPRHRDSNASVDSILVAKATLSQRSSPTDSSTRGVTVCTKGSGRSGGAQVALTLGNAVANAPSTPQTDRHFLGDTLTLKTEQLKQRVAIKKAARRALRESQRRSSTKVHHHGTVRGGENGQVRNQHSVESIEAGKCSNWINRSAARKQNEKRQRKKAVGVEQKPSDEAAAEKHGQVLLVFAPPDANLSTNLQETPIEHPHFLPTIPSASSSEGHTFGANSSFDYADNTAEEITDEEPTSALLPPFSVHSPTTNSVVVEAENVLSTANESLFRTLTLKKSTSSSTSAKGLPPVNIVISPPSISSRSESIHSGSIGNNSTQV